jgi:hypothetical protein
LEDGHFYGNIEKKQKLTDYHDEPQKWTC